MKRRKALAGKNAPTRISLTFYAVVWLLLDRFNVDKFTWGVIGTLCAILFIFQIIDLFTAENIELDK